MTNTKKCRRTLTKSIRLLARRGALGLLQKITNFSIIYESFQEYTNRLRHTIEVSCYPDCQCSYIIAFSTKC